MSPDVQQRKRKDKRKKKDNEDITMPTRNPTDEVIHIYKERTLGGNVCTKVIFFALLGILGVVISFSIAEYRGMTDEDSQLNTDSPWSVMFQNWSEMIPDFIYESHNEELLKHSELEDEEVEKEEHDSMIQEEEECKDNDCHQEAVSDWSWREMVQGMVAEEISSERGGWFGWLNFRGSEVSETTGDGEDASDEEKEDAQGIKEEEDGDEEPGYLDEVSDESGEENVDRHRREEDQNESEEDKNLSSEDEENQNDSREENASEEDENISGERGGPDVEESEEVAVGGSEEQTLNDSEEEEMSEEDNWTQEDGDEDGIGSLINQEDEMEDDGDQTVPQHQEEVRDESNEDMFPETIQKLQGVKGARHSEEKELDLKAERWDQTLDENINIEKVDDSVASEGEQEEEGETGRMALKFGVGVALVVVAHVVLVKRWNSWVETVEVDGAVVQEVSAPTVHAAPPPPNMTLYQQSSLSQLSQVATTSQSPPVVEIPTPANLMPERTSESELEPGEEEPEEEEGYDEEEEEEEDNSDLDLEVVVERANEITAKKYQQLLAEYSHTLPSSDSEPSEDERGSVNREYSDGAEEESVGEEESGNENADISEPEEDMEAQQQWTSVRRGELTLESDVEPEEVEEEMSEEETVTPPPLPPSAPRRPAGGPKDFHMEYTNWDITNDEDWAIREELDRADDELNNQRTNTALKLYEDLLARCPGSARARWGRARSLDTRAEAQHSNEVLNLAIEAYLHALAADNIPDALLKRIAMRTINRMRFRGQHKNAVAVHTVLINRFNDTPTYMNDLAINYLMMNSLDEAGGVLMKVLGRWPKDAMAQSLYGLVLKLQGKHKECVPFLESGLAADTPETRDARLYFHLGDALSRTGRSEDAIKVYERGVEKGLFRSKYQRSLYNVDRLAARPWWTIEQTTYTQFFEKLEANWKIIRDEGLSALKSIGAFQEEAENLRDFGNWKQLELFARGIKYTENCRKAPVTCSLISEFGPARGCRRGQSKFSVMDAGTHVWPHCGPTNCRLRGHLGLVIPQGTSIRVAERNGTWQEGKVIVFDDSFEHEVWHNGTSFRLVLIVDVWHPELTKQERLSLSPI